jgi:hypothetical protein
VTAFFTAGIGICGTGRSSAGPVRPRFRSLDKPLGRRTSRQRPFALPGPATPGHFGAVPIAAAFEDVAVTRQQRTGGDELRGVVVAGEPEPGGAAMGGVPEPGDCWFSLAAGGADQDGVRIPIPRHREIGPPSPRDR